jgi:hypothetical protein
MIILFTPKKVKHKMVPWKMWCHKKLLFLLSQPILVVGVTNAAAIRQEE